MTLHGHQSNVSPLVGVARTTLDNDNKESMEKKKRQADYLLIMKLIKWTISDWGIAAGGVKPIPRCTSLNCSRAWLVQESGGEMDEFHSLAK